MLEVRAQTRGIVRYILIVSCLAPAAEAQEPFRYDGAITFGGPDVDWLSQIEVDHAGNTYVCGAFFGTVSIAPGFNITSAGSYDTVVAAFTPDRALKWARVFSGPGRDLCYDIKLDRDGDLLVCGVHGPETNFDSTFENPVFGESENGFIAKLLSNGSVLWVRGALHSGYVAALTADSENNIYATGALREPYDPPLWSAFAAKYDKTGLALWKHSLHTDPSGHPYPSGSAIVVDSNGVPVLTGSLMIGNRYRAYTARLRPSDGRPLWERITEGDGGIAVSYSMASDDNDGALFITGAFSGTVDLDPTPGVDTRTSSGSLTMFVSKYDSQSGYYLWSYSPSIANAGPTVRTAGGDIAVSRDGGVYVTGSLSGSIDFAPGRPVGVLGSGPMSQTMFILVLDSSASYQWAGTMVGDGPGYVDPGGLFTTANDLYACGAFNGLDIDLDPTKGIDIRSSTVGPRTTTLDAYVIKLIRQ